MPTSLGQLRQMFADLNPCVLCRDGRDVAVQRLIFDLLLHFVRHPNVLVTKQDLIRDVWKNVVVGDGSISQAVSILRRVLGTTTGAPPSLRTVWGHGYRFVAEVVETGLDAATEVEAASLAGGIGATPFVGRDDVMVLLARALADVRRGEARVVLLTGEPGIGKTRVCLELSRMARADGVRVELPAQGAGRRTDL